MDHRLALWCRTKPGKYSSVEAYQLLMDLHKSANRQGPGGDAETEKALSLAMTDRAAPLKIFDPDTGAILDTNPYESRLKGQVYTRDDRWAKVH
jgi:hypothetical protein